MAERTDLEPGEILAAVEALKDQAMAAAKRLAEELELERRLKENPMGTLALAAGAGFLLGGGLWPVLRPFARAAVRTVLSPQNLVALAAAAGALKAAQGVTNGEAPPEPEPTTAH